MKHLLIAVFFLALIIGSTATEKTQCPQNGSRDLIQTGMIEFTNTKQR